MTSTHDYGRRIIPTIFDERAQSEPDRIVYSIAVSSDISYGFRDITARQFADSINKTSWWLHEQIGTSSTYETIAYIGPHDLRYVLLNIAAVKTGYKLLLLSPRNTVEGSIALLRTLDCQYWVLPSSHPSLVPKILSSYTMKVLAIPEVADLLECESTPHYIYEKTWAEAATEPFCILHTSGSTGLPKPITWNHGLLGTMDAIRLLPHVDEGGGLDPWTSIWTDKSRLYSAFPFFHGAATIMNILMNAFYGMHTILGPVGMISNLSLVESMADHGKIAIWSLVPSLVDELGETPDVLAKLSSSKFICASGGPIGESSSEKVNKVVRVLNMTGTTEGLFIGNLIPDREDWLYFSFHPYSGFDFKEVDSGLYEQWIIRNEHHELFQGIFHTFKDQDEVCLKDLYAKHPTKPNLWVYRGRTDDMVVLSNGNKIQPLNTEAIIGTHPSLSACLVVGTFKFQAALLVELKEPAPTSLEERRALVDSIFDTVQMANVRAPGYAQIHKEFIMFASPDKPFARTDKSTVKRRLTLELYATEIEEFYKEREHDGTDFVMDTTSPDTMAAGVKEILGEILPVVNSVGPDVDLFSVGLDSLLAFKTMGRVRSSLRTSTIDPTKLHPRILYVHPSVQKFSAALFSLAHPTMNGTTKPKSSQVQLMNELRQKYYKRTNTANIVLTGSTGSLGSYLLESLLSEVNVDKIYCLNRADDGRQKQEEISNVRGLTCSWPAERVEFVQADLSRPCLGLSREKYKELLQQATHVIHNQWPVNFNWELNSFEPYIRGVRRLVDFCLDSQCDASLLFVSTIGSVSHLVSDSLIPEAPNHMLSDELGGYSASKLVCELILEDAVALSGVKATVVRVGQIAGPVKRQHGMWAKREWIPTIIATSKYLRMLPSTLPSMNTLGWIPVDILADIIVELTGVDDVASLELANQKVNGLDNGMFVPEGPKLEPASNGVNGIKKGLSNGIMNGVPNDVKNAVSVDALSLEHAINSIDGAKKAKPGDVHSQKHSSPLRVYHTVNPHPTNWSHLLPVVAKYLGESTKVVPWSEWLEALRHSQQAATVEDLESNPGLKLIDFFEAFERTEAQRGEMPVMDTQLSRAKSRTLSTLQPVGAEWMNKWLRQWAF